MAMTQASLTQACLALPGDVLRALSFLTRLPWPGSGRHEASDLSRGIKAFALAGAIIGALGGAVYALAAWVGLPPLLAALLAIALLLLITGGLHEDGLADLADAFGGGRNPEAKLAIMRDSRLGSFGALALIMALALRVGALSTLAEPGTVVLALMASQGLSRATLPWAMALATPASTHGLAAALTRPDRAELLVLSLTALALAVLLLGWTAGLSALLAGSLGALLILGLALKQIGGYNGDVLGAQQQVSEIFILLTLVILQ